MPNYKWNEPIKAGKAGYIKNSMYIWDLEWQLSIKYIKTHKYSNPKEKAPNRISKERWEKIKSDENKYLAIYARTQWKVLY